MKVVLVALALAATVGLAPATVVAQEAYPSKPIKFIVPYSPGGASDVIARAVGEQLTQRFKQPVIVESRTGAAGQIGANACRQAPPDGYTFCILLTDILAIHPYTFKKLPYDVSKDFASVISLVNVDAVVIASGKSPAKDLRELAALEKKAKGRLIFGSFGTGSSAHLLLERMSRVFSVEITHVPYQGGIPANMAVMGGLVDMSLSGYGIIAQHIAAGTVKPVAVLGKMRIALLPNTPTLSEQGIDSKAELWQALFAPKGTPASVINTINAAINEILRDPAFVARHLTPGGYTVTGGSPADLDETIRQDSAEWSAIAKALNLSLE